MVIHDPSGTIAISSGTGFVTLRILGGILNTLVIVPPSESVTYDFTVENNQGFLVFDEEAVTGTFSGRLEIAMKDPGTLTISNSTSDDSFTYQATFVERYD